MIGMFLRNIARSAGPCEFLEPHMLCRRYPDSNDVSELIEYAQLNLSNSLAVANSGICTGPV